MHSKSPVKSDYKSRADVARRPQRGYTRHIVLAALGLAILTAVLAFAPWDARATREADSGELDAQAAEELARITVPLDLSVPGGEDLAAPDQITVTPPASAPEAPAIAPEPAENGPAPESSAEEAAPAAEWKKDTVKRGDTLSAIFKRQGLSPRELHDIMALGKPTATLKRLYPGQEFRFQVDGEGRLLGLVYKIDELESLHVSRTDDDGFTAKTSERPLETRSHYASATIENSLFLAGQKAGLSNAMIMELANIFGWDIDFVLDIRSGDSFRVLYEEQYLDGEKIRDGAILAAEFTNQGKTYQAVRFETPDGHAGYYTPEGLSMRKAFLRTPVHFSRISSRFNPHRLHPKLGIRRPHRGVDYAAPSGTPIRAAGDGKIIFRGRKGGYGRVIIIQHGGRYSTLYAHMSRFARHLAVGSRVRQGQTIGYVGMSGLATGPHLHYEFRVNGVHRNPLTVRLPKADPISDKYRDAFAAKSARLLAQLDLHKSTELALSRHDDN